MKQLAILLLIFLTATTATAQYNSNLDRPKVAVVLSGGGAKGVAHISALKVIEEAGIPVDIICGTSMGSLIGGLYSIGWSPKELDSLVRSQNWTFLLSDRTNQSLMNLSERRRENTYALGHTITFGRRQQQGGGVLAGSNLAVLFENLCEGYLDSMDFNQLSIPFACVATDIVTNTEVDFHSGFLPQAMRSSMAIPGVFTPVRIGDSVLVDGGLRNNYPADIARAMGADIIIGVTVQGDLLKADELSNTASILGQIVDYNCKNKYEDNLRMSDIVMKVNVEGYSAASFVDDAIDTLLRRGEEEALRHWDELVALRERFFSSGTIIRHHRPHRDTSYLIHHKSSIHKQPIARVGFRFDSEELGSLLLGIAAPIKIFRPSDLHASLRLGNRLMAQVGFDGLFSINYTFRRNDLDIYSNGIRNYNIRYRQHQADFVPFNYKLKKYTIQVGIRWDYYDYYGRLLSLNGSTFDTEDDHYFSYRLEANLNTENRWYFPSKGQRVHIGYAYRTTNLVQFKNDFGLSDIIVHWRINIPLTPRLTLQPMIYGRCLLGKDIPFAFRNALGNETFSHYIEQQLPFAGIGNVEYIDNQIAALQLQLSCRISKSHYVLVRGAAATTATYAENLLQLPDLYGVQAGYSYVSLFGPIDVRVGWSTRTRKANIYLNFGHIF